MPEFKKIQDLLTTENPTKAVVLDDNNELKLADYAGGGGAQEEYVVTFTGEDDEWSADKTFAEITDAINSGKKVVADYAEYEPAQRLQMTAYMEDIACLFAGVITTGGYTEMIALAMQPDDTIFAINGKSLPSVDDNDNGKVLTVVDGEWEAENSSELMVDIEVNDTFTSVLSITPSFDDIVQAIKDGKKVAARAYYEYAEDDEIENEYFYTNSVIYTESIDESKGDNSRELSIEFNTPKDGKVPYSYAVNMVSEDGDPAEIRISETRDIPLNDVDVGSLLQYYEKDGRAYWRDTTINNILSVPSTAGKVLTSTGNNQMGWQDSSSGTAYIDVTMTSDTTFTASYKGQPATTNTVIGLVNDNFTVIAKVVASENSYQFVPLTSMSVDDGNAKSSCSFSIVALSENAPVLLVAKISSDDGGTGHISITPI